MSTEHDQDTALGSAHNPFDVIAYAGWEVLGAERVAVAVAQPSEQLEENTAATVRGWYGSSGAARHGQRLLLAPDIPFDTVTAVDVERQSNASLSLSAGAPRDGGQAQPVLLSGAAIVLRGVTADRVGLAVLVEYPTRLPREGLTRFLRALLVAADRVVAEERSRDRQRIRAGLQEREEERRRWARELHDETLQQMGALQVLLTSAMRNAEVTTERRNDVVEALQTATAMLTRQITGLRHLITELRPATLDELGLSAPLHALARRTEELTGLRVQVHVSLRYSDGQLSTRLLPDIEVAVYRVVQEALTNASRHSGGTRAWISVVEDDDEVRVEVSDNGKGIHQVATAPGFGIIGMQERALLAGGRLKVLPGSTEDRDGGYRGTVIRLVVPATHRPPEPVQQEPSDETEGPDAERPHS